MNLGPAPFFKRQVTDWLLEDSRGRQRVVEVRLAGFKRRKNITWSAFAWRDGERAVAARLSCSHWYRLRRLWNAETKEKGPARRKRGPMTSGFPCTACGSGDRRAAEDSRAKQILRDGILRAANDVFLLPCLVEALWEGLRASRLPPRTALAESIYESFDRNYRMAGLHETHESVEQEEEEEAGDACPGRGESGEPNPLTSRSTGLRLSSGHA